MIQVAGDRDMAAQETAHMLLSLPLVGCSFSFVTVCLENSRKVILDEENQGDEVLQDYGERTTLSSRYTGLSQLNLMRYVSQYTKVRGELTKRANPYVVRTFPKISANPGGPDFGKYCKYQLIKIKSWEGQPSNAWNNEEESDEMFINIYDRFLLTDSAEEYVFRYYEETDLVHAALHGQDNEDDQRQDESDDDESEVDAPIEENVDDWMLLCRINQQFQEAGNQMSDNEAVDWFEEVRAVPRDLLRESPGWIYSKRKEAEELGQQYQEDQLCVSDPETLNDKQRLAFDLITSQNDDNAKPVHMIVSGTASTGETYLISAVKQVLGAHCIVTATTGIAAFSINGQTLHSAAQLPIREYRDLQGDSLQRLQLRLEGKRFLIVDEMSMIGHKMLSSLDNRLRAGTGKEDIPFGGMSVILMGDFNYHLLVISRCMLQVMGQ